MTYDTIRAIGIAGHIAAASACGNAPDCRLRGWWHLAMAAHLAANEQHNQALSDAIMAARIAWQREGITPEWPALQNMAE